MGPADHCMGRGGASSHPPALTGPGGPGRRSGRRRQCLPRLWWPSSWAAGPERSRGASGTTPGRPPRQRSRPAGCSRLRRCYTGRHGVSVGLRPAPSHADLPGLGHSPVCSPLCSGPPGGSALEVDPAVQLEGGLGARGLGPWGVHAVAEVEPTQGVDVLPGKVVQRPQGAAGWVWSGGGARVGGSSVRARPRVPTTATHTAGRATPVPTALTWVSRRAERPPSPAVLRSLGGGSGAGAAEGSQIPGLPAPPTVDPATLWLVHGPSLSLECCPAPFSGCLPFWKVPCHPPLPLPGLPSASASLRVAVVTPGFRWLSPFSPLPGLRAGEGSGLGKASGPRWGLPL